MPIFTILHLSDLHINKDEQSERRQLRQQLILDVQKVVADRSFSIDVVAMTGDIVDRGGTLDAYAMGADFLKDLSDVLGLSTHQILVIPGNHDVPRRPVDRALLASMTDEVLSDPRQANEYWEAMKPRFSMFETLRAQFGQGQDTIPGCFGAAVQTLTTKQGRLRAVLLNSAWSTIGNDDFGRIQLGRFQLDTAYDVVRGLPPADLTVALLHHPVDWLQASERALLVDCLKDSDRLGAQALLHGHIHNGTVEIFADPDGTLLSLVSGIGYPDAAQQQRGREKLSSCRYAIYRFDTTAKTVDVCLRVSRSGGSFAADTLLYKRGSETGTFTLPYQFNAVGEDQRGAAHGTPGDPVPLISDWVGRTRELSSLLNPGVRVAAITAIGGQGKTGLASEFLRRYGQGENSRYAKAAWADCREVPHTLHVKVMEVLEALTAGEESVERFQHEHIDDTVKRFLDHLRRTPTLLVFDNVDSYIRADIESPTSELLPFFEAALGTEHQSLVIFTCRPPIADSNGAFRHIALTGLSPAEGVELFRKRLGELSGPNAEDHCVRLVQLTNGHPWWLGLIAGQVSSHQDTLKACADRLSRGEDTWDNRVSNYFEGIWNQLNKRAQTILRYLVEAPRPLTDLEVSYAISDLGPVKIGKEIRRLLRLGLVELHEDGQHGQSQYQVHPLARRFVHNSYKREAQRPYVTKILNVFLPRSVVDKLHLKTMEAENPTAPVQSLADLADSIETCLQSRYEDWALRLLNQYGSTLYDSGLHHRFQSLAARTLDLMDWKQVRITEQPWGQLFLGDVLDQLSVAGNSRCQHYLRRFEALVEPGTIAYLMYLSLAARIAWQAGNVTDALNLLDQYQSLAQKLDCTDYIRNPKYTRALALRDSGKYDDALRVFMGQGNGTSTRPDAEDLGNAARCLLKLNRFDESEDLLAECLIELRRVSTYLSATNRGYAYLWIAETLLAQGLVSDAKHFLLLARHMWREYAPGLMGRSTDCVRALKFTAQEEGAIPLETAIETEQTFLDRGAWARRKVVYARETSGRQ